MGAGTDPTGPASGEPASSEPDEDTFADILATAGEHLAELTPAEIDVWTSSALAVWREPGDGDPDPVDRRFLRYLDASESAEAATLAASARRLLAARPEPAPDGALSLITARADGRSIALGFCSGTEAAHSLLVDVDDAGLLRDVQAGPGLEQLVEGFEDTAVGVEEIDVAAAAASIAEGWRRAVAAGVEPTEAQVSNDALARARLAAAGHRDLPRPGAPAPVESARDPEADAAAVATLATALPASELTVDEARTAGAAGRLVRWDDPPPLRRAELEALASLEWADWLGAVIGVVREGVGVPVTPAGLVDHVNRCPEVTTSIPKRDRPWFEHAFAVVLEQWRELGVVDADDRLTVTGERTLPAALRQAWG